MKPSLILAVVFLAGIMPGRLTAAPTGANLVTACEQALAGNFTGIEGQMCTWYVTPCDCTYGGDSQLPRVCLPPAVPVDELARTVIAALRVDPSLQSLEAGMAAAEVLSGIYPCSDQPKGKNNGTPSGLF